MNTRELIQKMNEEIIQQKPSVFSEKIYSDEPIIRTASQLKKQSPSSYSQMRRIYFESFRNGYTTQRVFVQQGKFMEDFEESYDFQGSFSAYFPTYQDMTDAQLRGYFSWRTKARQGDIRETSVGFAYVYMYELINQIGVDDPEDGFYRLYEFYREYSRFAPELHRYVPSWLTDYIAYYNLELSRFSSYLDLTFEKDLDTLENCRDVSGKALAEAVSRLSDYDFTQSPFYKEYPGEFSYTLCRAIREYSEKYDKSHQLSFVQNLFGKICQMPLELFSFAVFYNDREKPDRTVEFTPSLVYTFKDGNCLCRKCWGKTGKTKNSRLGMYVKYTESVLREVFSYEKQLSATEPAKKFGAIVRTAAQTAFDERTKRLQAEKRSFVNADLLEGIIKSADKTRDKLITAEETMDEQATATAEIKAVPPENSEKVQESTVEKTCSLPLEEAEKEFVLCLLSKGDIRSFAKERHIKTSLMCDSINEKLYDIFYDTVIDFEGDSPTLNPDVIDMLNDSFKS